jgi:hypothetical protein
MDRLPLGGGGDLHKSRTATATAVIGRKVGVMKKRNWLRNAICSSRNGILGLWLTLTAAVPSMAEPYRLEIAAQVGDVIDGYTITELTHEAGGNIEGGGPYSISDQGEIAFIARISGLAYDGYAVMTNRRVVAKIGDVIDGRVLTTVLDEDAVPMINNRGQVSYRAEFDDRGPSRGIYTLVFDNRIIAERGMHVGGHILGNDISLGATLDDLGRAIFWASTANSTETGVPWGLFSQHGLLWSNGPQQVAGEEALGAWHFVSLNGQHHGLGVRLRDDSVPAGNVDAIATPDEILNSSTVIRQ